VGGNEELVEVVEGWGGKWEVGLDWTGVDVDERGGVLAFHLEGKM
jgi:hypothetical protein